MKQKVVVIGHGYAVRLGIIRSLAEMNCDITVVVINPYRWFGRLLRFEWGTPIDCKSRYVNRYYFCRPNPEDELIHLLESKCICKEQKVIIIPDSDFSAAVIDKNMERLKEHFLFQNIKHTPGAVEHWMGKTVQKQLAREIGLNVAEGRTVTVKDGAYSLPGGIEYPCFTKPLQTINGGKQFLKRCNNEDELRAVLDRVGLHFNTDVLIEDFKTIETEYAVVGFSDGKNVVIPGVIEFIVNSQSHFGIAREGKIMPVTGFEPLLDKFKEYVRRIGFCGLFDIDFYESGGKMYFGEMNLRFGGSGYAYTVMGANLPAIMVRHLRGEDYSNLLHDITHTATYVNERMVMDDYLHGFIDDKEYNQITHSANISFVNDSNDRGPGRKFDCTFTITRLKKIRLRLIKK